MDEELVEELPTSPEEKLNYFVEKSCRKYFHVGIWTYSGEDAIKVLGHYIRLSPKNSDGYLNLSVEDMIYTAHFSSIEPKESRLEKRAKRVAAKRAKK